MAERQPQYATLKRRMTIGGTPHRKGAKFKIKRLHPNFVTVYVSTWDREMGESGDYVVLDRDDVNLLRTHEPFWPGMSINLFFVLALVILIFGGLYLMTPVMDPSRTGVAGSFPPVTMGGNDE